MKPQLCRICSFVFWITWLKNERSMTCKVLFDKQCPLVQYRKKSGTHNFIFFFKENKSIEIAANGSKIFFIRQSEITYDRIICSFAISLIQGRTNCLCFLLSFIYVLVSVTNNLKKLLTILSVCCYPLSTIFKK